MARIIPPDYRTADTLHESERQTLEHLEEALPDSYTVFSSVLWARSRAFALVRALYQSKAVPIC